MNKDNIIKDQSAAKPLYVITGATGAMGRVISKRLAAQDKALILACRDMEKGEKLVKDLKEFSSNNDITAMHLDLSSFARVKALSLIHI